MVPRSQPRDWRPGTLWGLILIAILGTACNDLTGPPTGTLTVTVTTTGADLDEDGYSVVVDGGTGRPILPSGTVELLTSEGDHVITLSGIAANCVLDGPSTRTISVEPGSNATLAFLVACEATGVRIVMRTTGLDIPPEFFVQIDDRTSRDIGPTAELSWTRLTPGEYTVTLTGLASDIAACEAAGGHSVTVSVTNRAVADVTFDVTCGATYGVLVVTTVTLGEDVDLNGYLIRGDGVLQQLPANGVRTLATLRAGTYELELTDVQSNCEVAGLNVRSIQLSSGTMVRDTARVDFELTCTRAQKIAYVTGLTITVAHADGTAARLFRSGVSPTWSRDGKWLAYDSCDPWYSYYYGCEGMRLLDVTTGVDTPFPGGVSGAYPEWSPDGEAIAFVASGSNPGNVLTIFSVAAGTLVPIEETRAITFAFSAPAWSPDGSKLAFACIVEKDQLDICVINRDGTGLTRLTNSPFAERDPSWSPDGALIAFSRYTIGGPEIVLMSPSGEGSRRLTSGHYPAWSPDGSKILYAVSAVLVNDRGLFVINADGSGIQRLTRGTHYDPAWQP